MFASLADPNIRVSGKPYKLPVAISLQNLTKALISLNEHQLLYVPCGLMLAELAACYIYQQQWKYLACQLDSMLE